MAKQSIFDLGNSQEDEEFADKRNYRGPCQANPECELLDGHDGEHYIPVNPRREDEGCIAERIQGASHEFLLVAKRETRLRGTDPTVDTTFVYKCSRCDTILDL